MKKCSREGCDGELIEWSMGEMISCPYAPQDQIIGMPPNSVLMGGPDGLPCPLMEAELDQRPH
jgi:hypothetical protein